VGWALVVLFLGLPFLKLNGRPAIFLDVLHREFTFFGRTFFATDGILLMLLMLSIFVSILWLTALVGRAWCGYGCPQTVYLEFVFRPIEKLLEGDSPNARSSGAKKVLKNAIFLVLSVVLGNVFLSYFVSVDTLAHWVARPPGENFGGFLVMGVTSLLVFFDFAYFREQMCTVICPYARLQSALLDKDSLLIAYDEKRGEPRKKGKWKEGDADCIDCGACTRACPTGIDIRDGLQLECIACGQCVDACDGIMDKIKRPRGLIRYTTKRSLAEGVTRVLRTRVVLYSLLLTLLLLALTVLVLNRRTVDVTVLRGIGAPYVEDGTKVRNQIRVKLENRSRNPETFHIALRVKLEGRELDAREAGVTVINPEDPLKVGAENRRTTTLFVVTEAPHFSRGELAAVVTVTPVSGGEPIRVPYKLLGPLKL
jgi:cytochrome c oxidase accessory protein FixG